MEDNLIAKVLREMVHYDRGDVRRIHHFLKVHDLAACMGRLEGLDAQTQLILEVAAIVHDIGIHSAERLHGSSAGHWQELLGPPEALRLMEAVGGFSQEQMARVAFLVGHHHSYAHIDALDWQILVEADCLVNFYEDDCPRAEVQRRGERLFRTASGRHLLADMFLAEPWTGTKGGMP